MWTHRKTIMQQVWVLCPTNSKCSFSKSWGTGLCSYYTPCRQYGHWTNMYIRYFLIFCTQVMNQLNALLTSLCVLVTMISPSLCTWPLSVHCLFSGTEEGCPLSAMSGRSDHWSSEEIYQDEIWPATSIQGEVSPFELSVFSTYKTPMIRYTHVFICICRGYTPGRCTMWFMIIYHIRPYSNGVCDLAQTLYLSIILNNVSSKFVHYVYFLTKVKSHTNCSCLFKLMIGNFYCFVYKEQS